MNSESEGISLCCCEYYDNQRERNHILACCCNCVDVDEGFESLISGKEFPHQRRARLMATIQDRMRIPWRGGARQISLDTVLPVFILPVIILLSTISLWWTIFAFTTMAVFLLYIYISFMRSIPSTKFFYIWSIMSFIILYTVFEFIVIEFLEIMLEENLALAVLIVGFLICMYKIKVKTIDLRRFGQDQAEKGSIGGSDAGRVYNCNICQVAVPEHDRHCVWIDCCIGQHNRIYFLLALFFVTFALLYSSNLAMTSVCLPLRFYKTILLPRDCRDAYNQFEFSLCFVCSIYSLIVGLVLFLLFIHQILLISLGLTGHEWKALSASQKCCYGLTTSRPNNRGFFLNWYHVISCSSSQYVLVKH